MNNCRADNQSHMHAGADFKFVSGLAGQLARVSTRQNRAADCSRSLITRFRVPGGIPGRDLNGLVHSKGSQHEG